MEMELRSILSDILGRDAFSFQPETPLLGAIPEFDSMAVMRLIVEMETRLHVSMDDMELTADTFRTFDNLLSQLQSTQHAA